MTQTRQELKGAIEWVIKAMPIHYIDELGTEHLSGSLMEKCLRAHLATIDEERALREAAMEQCAAWDNSDSGPALDPFQRKLFYTYRALVAKREGE